MRDLRRVLIYQFPLILTSESTWRHHMEVDSEYIFVDLMDTAGEVCKIENKIIK